MQQGRGKGGGKGGAASLSPKVCACSRHMCSGAPGHRVGPVCVLPCNPQDAATTQTHTLSWRSGKSSGHTTVSTLE